MISIAHKVSIMYYHKEVKCLIFPVSLRGFSMHYHLRGCFLPPFSLHWRLFSFSVSFLICILLMSLPAAAGTFSAIITSDLHYTARDTGVNQVVLRAMDEINAGASAP